MLKLGCSRQFAVTQFIDLLCKEDQIDDATELIDCVDGMLILGVDIPYGALRHFKTR